MILLRRQYADSPDLNSWNHCQIFSANFNSFLREVGAATARNYHTNYFNTADRPTYNYTIGDANVPFYKAPKQQIYANMAPCPWNDVKIAFPEKSKLINDLTNEDRYVFKIKDRFDNILGAHAEFRWDEQTPGPVDTSYLPAID